MRETVIGEHAVSLSDNGLTLRSTRSSAEITLSPAELRELTRFLGGDEVEGLSRRAAFRVPVPQNGELVVSLVRGERSAVVRALNLSYTGAFIAGVQEAVGEPLATDERIVLHLTHRDETVLVNGVVRRVTPEGCGILFPDALRDEELVPDPLVKRIVDGLQHKRVMQMIRQRR